MGSPVPVTLGATRSRGLDVTGARVTSVVFPPGADLARHQHARTTIAVVLRGGFLELHGSRERSCPPGTLLIEPAGEPHANRFGAAATSVVAVNLEPGRAGTALESLVRRLSFSRDPFATALAAQLRSELEHPDDVSPLAVEAWVLELLAGLLRARQDDGGPRWLRDARDLVTARYAEALRLSDIAATVGVEPTRLARAFRREYREPISSYLRRRRVAAAAELLELGDQPIARIAADVGFADQSHLTRAFVRSMRTTPGRYRTERRRRPMA
jgi:AraC family transcriptional regulator